MSLQLSDLHFLETFSTLWTWLNINYCFCDKINGVIKAISFIVYLLYIYFILGIFYSYVQNVSYLIQEIQSRSQNVRELKFHHRQQKTVSMNCIWRQEIQYQTRSWSQIVMMHKAKNHHIYRTPQLLKIIMHILGIY